MHTPCPLTALFLGSGWLVPRAAAACPFAAAVRTLTEGLSLREAVDVAAGTLTVQLEYQGEAWLGFGFSTDGKMAGSEAVIGLPEEGTVQLYDMTAESAAGIVPWPSQTLTDASIVQANGVTTLTFTKPLADAGKIEILADGPNTFLYAYGASNTFGLHEDAKDFNIDLLQQCSATAPGTETISDGGTAEDDGGEAGDGEATDEEEDKDSDNKEENDKPDGEDEKDKKDEKSEEAEDSTVAETEEQEVTESGSNLAYPVWMASWLLVLAWGVLS